MALRDQITALANRVGIEFNTARAEYTEFKETLGGGFLLDPNEFNGYRERGIYDDNHTGDLGNVGDANISRLAGGFMYPWDVELLGFKAFHHNNNAGVLPWGWRICYVTKDATPAAGSNNRTTTDLYRECIGTGATATAPRNYGNNTNQATDQDFTGQNLIIPAGSVLTLGVEAPTAVTTNRYVFIHSGYFLLRRIL